MASSSSSSRIKKRRSTLEKRIDEIRMELVALKRFRPTKQRDQFIRQLAGEQSFVKRQLSTLLSSSPKRETKHERQQRQAQANRQRSEKMKRNWRYLKSIQENYYPEKGLKELRSLLKKHVEGLETEVSDIAWRNPSP
jgi:hypothetical protein